MKRWLFMAWEPNWRSFQYFNLYRLVVATVLVAATFLSQGWLSPVRIANLHVFDGIGVIYLLAISAGALLSVRWQRGFDLQLSMQVLLDVVAVTMLMHLAGGLSSGLGVLLLVSLAAASLVGRGRLVLFYAAMATLAVLLMQIIGVLRQEYEATTIVQAGFLSAGFFATAILARLLGQRLMVNEELARRRGVALENQTRISQRVIERMQDGVLVAAPDGRVLRHNPVAAAMLSWGAAVPPSLAEFSGDLAGAFRSWSSGQHRGPVNFAAGPGRELRARFETTDSSDGEVLIFLEDMGRIQDQAQQLKLAALGRLTASIAHEIRNPLAAISHAGDLLQEERRGDIQDRLLRILQDNVKRLDRIVEDVLELGSRDRVQPEVLRLDEFLREFIDEFARTENAPADTFVVEDGGPCSASFDRSHLRQILWNLVGNALRHSRRQPGSVHIRLAMADDGRLELQVIDDGPGVPADLRSQVFEPFFTTHHKGTGLGLFIARELCEANGASLQLGGDATGGHFVVAWRNETCQQAVPNDAPAVN